MLDSGVIIHPGTSVNMWAEDRRSIYPKPDRCLTYIESVNFSFSFIYHPSPAVQWASANHNGIFLSRPSHENAEAMGKSSLRILYARMNISQTYRPGYIINEGGQNEYNEENEMKLRELEIKFTLEFIPIENMAGRGRYLRIPETGTSRVLPLVMQRPLQFIGSEVQSPQEFKPSNRRRNTEHGRWILHASSAAPPHLFILSW
ncbi:hypothetical protein ARMSODRAFT_979142 [Armillaria solidipes]|uniref:Uncharacterized protein n=1 Tax=Armillaria solidipes TaxID=1076256 RepID=A0A2H3B096_9AGAR|nr:hypothetical protein ARMSODRAFT_979142 [Armillaria solidipes]